MTKVGIIGVGKHAEQSHIQPLAAQDGCEITALADLNEIRSQQMKDLYAPEARTTTDWHDIVEDPSIEAVFAMTPDRFHTEQLAGAVAAGKHVLVEKPLADTMPDFEQVRRVLGQAAEKGLVVSSCHPRRFDPPFIHTKYLLDNRHILSYVFEQNVDADLGPATGLTISLNYSRPSKSGLHTSFMSDHLPHEIDTANHFFGFSNIKSAVCKKNEELAFDVSAQREDGIMLHFQGNRLQEEKGFKEDWQITFASGAVLGVDAHNGQASFLHKDGKPLLELTAKSLFKTNYDSRFTALNQHFIDSIRHPGAEKPYLTNRELLLNTVAALALQDVGSIVHIKV